MKYFFVCFQLYSRDLGMVYLLVLEIHALCIKNEISYVKEGIPFQIPKFWSALSIFKNCEI